MFKNEDNARECAVINSWMVNTGFRCANLLDFKVKTLCKLYIGLDTQPNIQFQVNPVKCCIMFDVVDTAFSY